MFCSKCNEYMKRNQEKADRDIACFLCLTNCFDETQRYNMVTKKFEKIILKT